MLNQQSHPIAANEFDIYYSHALEVTLAGKRAK